nr:MAG TPA: hypothetical protein [Caudoviricetes sp.]
MELLYNATTTGLQRNYNALQCRAAHSPRNL